MRRRPPRSRIPSPKSTAGSARPTGSAPTGHDGKFKLVDLLDACKQRITLTEHGAMRPVGSISGRYFPHPEAKYFNVGRDEREDYAGRKGEGLKVTERWMASNLAYEPAEFGVKC